MDFPHGFPIFVLVLVFLRDSQSMSVPWCAAPGPPPTNNPTMAGAKRPPLAHPLAVLYGSQTGTAQDVAEALARQALRRGFAATVSSLDAFDISALPKTSLALFVVSTTGEGEAPDNMKSFWRFLLRRNLPADSLSSMRMAILGLGDSGYTKFNAAARRLRARLLQLGATEVASIGLGDDRSERGVEGDVDAWSKSLWAEMLRMYPIPSGCVVDDSPEAGPPVALRVVVADAARVDGGDASMRPENQYPACGFYAAPGSAYGYQWCDSNARPIVAKVLTNIRMTSPDWEQDVRHLVLQLPRATGVGAGSTGSLTQDCCFTAGDVAVVYPNNVFDPDLLGSIGCRGGVEAVAQMLGLSPHTVITLGGDTCDNARSGTSAGASLPPPPPLNAAMNVAGKPMTPMAPGWLPRQVSVSSLLTRFLDVLGRPRRYFLEQLSLWATDEEEREKLLELASAEGSDLYYDYVVRSRRNYLEVLSEFRSARPPLEQLMRLVPRLQPRLFSIANSQLHPGCSDQVHLAVAVLKHRTPFKERRHVRGVCSSWIAGLKAGDEVPMWFQRGGLRLPGAVEAKVRAQCAAAGGEGGERLPAARMERLRLTPIIFVGPGTGVAPMRAMLQERRSLLLGSCAAASTADDASKKGVCDLYFGCRHERKDFLFGAEWRAGLPDGVDSVPLIDMLHTAFSRDNPEGGGRIYVQHRMCEQAGRVWAMLSPSAGGCIYVAGSASGMVKGVREALLEVFTKLGGLTAADALKYLRLMERQGRYQCEAWS